MDFSKKTIDEEERKSRENCTDEDSCPDSIDKVTDQVRGKLIETWAMDELKDLLERRLTETGWKRNMMIQFRALVNKQGSNIKFDDLLANLEQHGKDSVSEAVKEELLNTIKYCYEK